MNTVCRKRALAGLLTGLLAAAAGGAPAAVTVVFSHPEHYRDMPFAPSERARVLKDLGDYFVSLGKDLPPGQDLRVEVTDLDMAGRIHPNVGGQDLRVLRGGADWPHMALRFRLESNGRAIAGGEESLSDMNYLNRLNRLADGDTLRYEKRMIDDWFKNKFVARKQG